MVERIALNKAKQKGKRWLRALADSYEHVVVFADESHMKLRDKIWQTQAS